MIIAAEAIPNNLSAEVLFQKSRDIIDGLKSHGVNVISYSCDGTVVERTVQDVRKLEHRSHFSHLPLYGRSPFSYLLLRFPFMYHLIDSILLPPCVHRGQFFNVGPLTDHGPIRT